jgi:Ca2+-binding RTX toxin-like protein
VDAEGNLSVGYTITCPTSQSAPDFTIGIYGSPDGRQPVTLLQTFDVDDSNLLTGSTAGITHTATFPADLGDLDANGFVVAKLDAYDEVYETTKSDNVSTPLLGAFQTPQGDGNVYVYSTATNIDVSQDQQTGVLTVTVGGTTYSFSNVGSVYLGIAGAGGTVHATGVDLPVSIYGGTGNYTIYGGDGGNTIYGGSGSDTIFGGAGSDTIHGGTAGGNHIYAGSGDATIWGDGGLSDPGNTIAGGNGSDTIHAGDGGDSITGGTGDDTIYGGQGADNIVGGSGNNEIYGGPNCSLIDGSLGKNNWIQGGSAASDHETIYGGGGSDWLYAGSGTDTIYGGGGKEVIHGGSGSDHLYWSGTAGEPAQQDDIYGGSGETWMYGYGGADRFIEDPNAVNHIADEHYNDTNIDTHDCDGDRTCTGIYASDGPTFDPTYKAATTGGSWDFSPSRGVYARLGEAAGDSTVAEVTVYVAWNPSDDPGTDPITSDPCHWTTDAQYTVSDATGLLATTVVNEPRQAGLCPSDSPDHNDHPWFCLGTFDAVGYVSISGTDLNAYDPLSQTGDPTSRFYFGDAMVRYAWPTVSIRPDLDGKQDFTGYDDYLEAKNPLPIPVEGEGDRVKMRLSITMPCGTNQLAVVPNVPGFLFWDNEYGGTALTAPDPTYHPGDVIRDEFYGTYQRDIWVSRDPDPAYLYDPPTSITLLAQAQLPDSLAQSGFVQISVPSTVQCAVVATQAGLMDAKYTAGPGLKKDGPAFVVQYTYSNASFGKTFCQTISILAVGRDNSGKVVATVTAKILDLGILNVRDASGNPVSTDHFNTQPGISSYLTRVLQMMGDPAVDSVTITDTASESLYDSVKVVKASSPGTSIDYAGDPAGQVGYTLSYNGTPIPVTGNIVTQVIPGGAPLQTFGWTSTMVRQRVDNFASSTCDIVFHVPSNIAIEAKMKRNLRGRGAQR